MNTKMVMSVSSFVLGAIGIVLTFIPEEIARYANLVGDLILPIIMLQLMGALYFSFAMINWTAKANLIGGIYGRPIAIGNLTHFVIGALALAKAYFASYTSIIVVPAIIYLSFAILFVAIFFTHPVQEKANK
jgi:hypothetical protein